MLAPCWTKLMCNRSAGELDVLLLMLCIQCKKMYTVWVRFTKEMEAGMFKTAELPL
jgi:hypothetical protein